MRGTSVGNVLGRFSCIYLGFVSNGGREPLNYRYVKTYEHH